MTWIKVHGPELHANRIYNYVECHPSLERYFKYHTFYAGYSREIKTKNKSILNIPVISSVITLAWITGSSLHVETLDKNFYESLKKLKQEFIKMYPAVLDGDLYVERLEDNKNRNNGLALFFSGGLDSFYSVFKLKERNPELIMVGGFDTYMTESGKLRVLQQWKKVYTDFAKREGLKINFIYTNSREIVDENSVNYRYGENLVADKRHLRFWDSHRHSILLLGLAAPLSTKNFNELVISASRTSDHPTSKLPYASSPETDEIIKWTDLSVNHYGRVHRYEKTKYLKEYMEEGRIHFRTCYRPNAKLLPSLNCNTCEKCLSLISMIASVDVDPNKCGFQVDDNTFTTLREVILKDLLRSVRVELHWGPWQEYLKSLDELPDVYGSKKFFEWFINYNLKV